MTSSVHALSVHEPARDGNSILNQLGFKPPNAPSGNWLEYPSCPNADNQPSQRPLLRQRSHSKHCESKSSSTDQSSSSTTYSDSSGGNPFASESDNEPPANTYENTLKSKPFSAQNRPSEASLTKDFDRTPSGTLHPAKLNELAGDLTSFLSRVKYLYDESETGESLPLSSSSVSSPTFVATLASSSSSYSDQRALIKAQADRVRNQLELKFSAVAFGAQLDRMSEKFDFSTVKPYYNPLHTIRDRRNPRASAFLPRHSSETPIWQVSVADIIQDMRWRYNQERVGAQKRRRHRSTESGSQHHQPRNASNTAFLGFDPSYQIRFNDGSQPNLLSRGHTAPNYSEDDLTDPHHSKRSRSSDPDTHFTKGLPDTECTKLIDRLRNQHDEKEIALLDDDDPPGLNSFGKDVTGRSDSVPYLAAGEPSDPQCPLSRDSKWAKRFCRNSVSVANTWNRMNKQRQNSTQSDISVMGGLKPPSVDSVGSTSRPASFCSDLGKNRRPSVDTANPLHRSSSASNDETTVVSNSSDPANSSVRNLSDPLLFHPTLATNQRLEAPLVKVTTENGGEFSVDTKPKWRAEPAPTQRSRSAASQPAPVDPPSLVGSDKWMGEEFGSLNIDTVRRNPLEKKCCHMAADLRYLKAFYTTALHRPSTKEVLRRCDSLEAMNLRFPEVRLSDSLKDDKLPEFLEFLGNIETMLVSQQQELDVSVATPLDGLRVSTDLMVSEVNTTLNRRIREVGSRIERLCLQRSGRAACTTTLYCFIEHAVTLLMWAIWCFVKCVRVLSLPLRLIRFLCGILIIA